MKQWKVILVVAASWSLMLGTVMAAVGEGAASSDALDTGVSVLRVVGGFLFVVALFLCGAWMVRRWQRGVGISRRRAPRLQVVESRSLGPRHTLYVVAYDQCRFLVAASPSGVNMISPLPEETATPAPPPPSATSFGEVLQQVLVRS